MRKRIVTVMSAGIISLAVFVGCASVENIDETLAKEGKGVYSEQRKTERGMSKTVDIGTATAGIMEGEILAVRSKDGKYTAFTKCVGEDKQVLHIYNQSMKKLDDVKVGDDILGSDIMSLEWMGEKQIAVMSHISPTTGCLDVYDVEKKENVFHVNCTDYAWSNEVESIVYVEPVSRFQTGNIHLLDYRGNVLYELSES